MVKMPQSSNYGLALASATLGAGLLVAYQYLSPEKFPVEEVRPQLKVGDVLPSVVLYRATPEDPINIKELFGDKKGIIFGLPGAFTPDCSATHLPGYVASHEELKALGVDLVVCVSVNDPYVMNEWEKAHNATGKVLCLADPYAEFTKAVGLDIHLERLGGLRSKRYSALVEGGKVVLINVEPDGVSIKRGCSLVNELVEQMQE